MFVILVVGLCVCVSAFPSYVPCASDADTLLRVGTHTCAATNKLKGSDIRKASVRQAALTAKKTDGTEASSIVAGETLTLELNTARLDWVLSEGLWMTVRVGDAGANGTLLADTELFEARCPSQMSSTGPIKKHITEMTYRAPCDASGDIAVTIVFSKCLFGCAQGVLDSGAVQPGQLFLVDLTLAVDADKKDPSCSQERPTPRPMPGLQDICHTTDCWDGGCQGDDVVDVPVRPMPVEVSKWDRVAKRYTKLGSVGAHLISDSRWGAMTHGARTLRGQGDEALKPGEQLPPLYVSDINNDIFRLDDITLGGTARSSRAAYIVSPAHQHHFYDEASGKLRGMVVASAQPFGVSPGAGGSQQITQGGVYAISPTSGCHRLWPNELDEPEHLGSGAVANSVTCHDASGICFFNNWEHLFDEASEFPHCLHWCALDNATDPTRCTASEPLAGGPNDTVIPGRFCAEPRTAKDGSVSYVATNGMLLGESRQDADGTWHIEAIVSWTDGKSGLKTGTSFARKVQLVARRAGEQGEASTVEVTSWEYFGAELWEDSVASSKEDVRLDHMWRDAAGYVWFSTFSQSQAHGGEHVLDYETGHLLYSYTGFGKRASPLGGLLPYVASGISTIGGFGQEGAYALVTAEAVPPLPVFKGGVFIVDISQLPSVETETLI